LFDFYGGDAVNAEPRWDLPIAWFELVFLKTIYAEFTKREKRDRCRDSMEAVLTNGVHYLVFIKESFDLNVRVFSLLLLPRLICKRISSFAVPEEVSSLVGSTLVPPCLLKFLFLFFWFSGSPDSSMARLEHDF
jgi:hypothetical protein